MNQLAIDNLAKKLHARFCNLSHEDQCSYYRGNKWAEESQERWRRQARELLGDIWGL